MGSDLKLKTVFTMLQWGGGKKKTDFEEFQNLQEFSLIVLL